MIINTDFRVARKALRSSYKHRSKQWFWGLVLSLLLANMRLCKADDQTERTLLEKEIHAGKIVAVTATLAPVKWISLEVILESGKIASDQRVTAAETERAPAAGKMFVVLQVELAESMSIGKYDYRLRVKDTVAACEGLARGRGRFDPRKWQVRAGKEGNQRVRMLFEVPVVTRKTKANLVPRIDTIVPLRTVEIPLVPPATLLSDTQAASSEASGENGESAVSENASD